MKVAETEAIDLVSCIADFTARRSVALYLPVVAPLDPTVTVEPELVTRLQKAVEADRLRERKLENLGPEKEKAAQEKAAKAAKAKALKAAQAKAKRDYSGIWVSC